MNKPCVLCGGPILGKPLFDDGCHNNLETCITNLKKRIAHLEKHLEAATDPQRTPKAGQEA
jgi:hypothetical protein